jgi:L-ribulose-5-phosphate 3-epimerase UlaE
MIQFGTGKANFAEVFQILKKADFKGPVMIECTGEPESPQDATQMAVKNRDFLKEVFSNLR